jgi:hypothetical protein
MCSKRKPIFAVAFLIAIAAHVFAQWERTSGPVVGLVNCIAINGTNLFAGTDSGAFISTNYGSSWSAINSGLSNKHINCLLVKGMNLFAGTAGGGVFLSTNNGFSWTAVNSGLTELNVCCLFWPSYRTLDYIYAGTTGKGVFISTNNGTSWTTNSFSNVQNITCIADGKALGNEGLYAGTSNGIFVSRSSASTGIPSDSGMPTTAKSIYCLYRMGINGNLLAGTNDGPYFYKHDNTWVSVKSGLPDKTIVKCITATGSQIFIGTNIGVFSAQCSYQTDYSYVPPIAWNSVSTGLANTYISDIVLVSGTNLYAGTRFGGIGFSTNNGLSWTSANEGLPYAKVFALAALGTKLSAGTNYGAFQTTDYGNSWSMAACSTSYKKDICVYSIAVDGSSLLIGTDTLGIRRSSDSGKTWISVACPFSTWRSTYPNNGITAILSGGQRLVVGSSYGLAENSDPVAWSILRTGLIKCITSGSGTDLYSGGDSGVYCHASASMAWTKLNSGLPNSSVNCILSNGSSLFAGTDGAGAFYSSNNGTTWSSIGGGLTGQHIGAFLINGSFLYAGTDSGVYVSSTNGNTWIGKNAGSSCRSITALSAVLTTLLAGTPNGVWRNSIETAIKGPRLSPPEPKPSQLTIAPSKNRKSLLLSIYLSKSENINIIAYSLDGRIMKTIYKGNLASGFSKMEWQYSSMACRICIIRLEREGKTEAIFVSF